MRTSTRWRRSISGRTSIRTASPARCASSSRSHPTKSTPSGSDVDLLVFAALPLPDVQAGDDLAALIANAIDRSGRAIEAGDVVVVAQKIVSKAEGAIVPLAVAGLGPLLDYRGCVDQYGRRLESTVMAIADEIASAAELVMRKTARTPVAIVRGAAEWAGAGTGRLLLRDAERDLFR